MKTTKNFKSRAPFGVATKRFDGMGFHPGLDPSGCMMKNKSDLAPGQYEIRFTECLYKTHDVGGSSWKRKADVEEFSKNLGFRNPRILAERTFRKSIGGPGFYDVPEELYQNKDAGTLPNVGFGRQKRFWTPMKHNNPPPGTYTDGIVKSHKCGQMFKRCPTFERDGFIDRFKNLAPPYQKPPNLYDPKDFGSIQALLTKVVSKRGPYDLFTGPRDGSTIKNHFAPPTFKGPLNWFNTYPNDLEILLTGFRKRRYGCFYKEARFGTLASKDESDKPSPCHYDIEREQEVKENMYPFNMSAKYQRPPIKWKIHPGVGRYAVKSPKCSCSVKNESCIFKSKTQRTQYKVVEYNSF